MSMAEAGRGGGAHGGAAIRRQRLQRRQYPRGGGSVGSSRTRRQVPAAWASSTPIPAAKTSIGGSGCKFHINPGGKYAYRGWSGKYDNHHHYGHYRRYGYYPWYGLPLYSYGGGCAYLYRRAVATGSAYWWDRYRRCSGVY